MPSCLNYTPRQVLPYAVVTYRRITARRWRPVDDWETRQNVGKTGKKQKQGKLRSTDRRSSEREQPSSKKGKLSSSGGSKNATKDGAKTKAGPSRGIDSASNEKTAKGSVSGNSAPSKKLVSNLLASGGVGIIGGTKANKSLKKKENAALDI